MSSTGAPAVNPTSYKTLLFQGAANMAMAHFAGTLRCLEHYKTESLAMAGLGTLAASLTQLLTQTTGKHDFKSFMLRTFAMGATIIGTSFALQKWSSVRALPFDRAARLVGLEFVAMGFVTVMSMRFGHPAPTRPPLSATAIRVPASARDVARISPVHISLYYERFQRDKGEWTTLDENVRSAFIQLFFTSGYGVIDLASDGRMNADWLELPETLEGVTKFSETQMVWIYRMIHAGTKRFSDLSTLVQHGFNEVFRNLEATGQRYFFYTVTLERLQGIAEHEKEEEIMNQLHFMYRPEKSERFDALPPQIQAHLNARFAHFGLEQRPEHSERLGTFTPENIRTLDENRINEWHAVLSANQVALWNDLPLEKKVAFNAKFAEFGKERLPLGYIAAFPAGMNAAELSGCHAYFVGSTPAWKVLDGGVRAQFIEAFYTNGTLGVIDEETDGTVNSDWLALPNSPETAAVLTDAQVQWLYRIFQKTNKFSTLPSILVQHAVNKRIDAVTGRFFSYPVNLRILQEIEGNETDEEGIMILLHLQFGREANLYRFASLSPEEQAHLNGRFVHFDKAAVPTREEQLQAFTSESIGALSRSAINTWHELFSGNQVALWNDLPLEIKGAFNAKFAEFGKDLLPWGDFEAYPEAASRAFFSTHLEMWSGLDRALRSRLALAYYAAQLPVVEEGTKAKLTTDTLVLPNSPEQVEALHANQVCWLREIFNAGTSEFDSLPILIQHALNVRMLEHVGRWRNYTPLTVEILQGIEGHEAEEAILTRIHDRQFRGKYLYRFDALPPAVQQQLNGRFAHYTKDALPTHGERLAGFTPETIGELNKWRAEEWYEVLSTNQLALWNGLPREKKVAFNTAFEQIEADVEALPVE